MKKVLISMELTEEEKEQFRSLQNQYEDDLQLSFFEEEKATQQDLIGIDAAIGWLTPDSVKGSDLDWLQIAYTGVEPFTRPGALSERTILTNCPGVYGPPVCELLVTHTLNLLKQTKRFFRQQQEHTWNLITDLRSLSGATVLILGMGDLGRRYAKVMKAFGATTIGVRKHPDILPDGFDSQGDLSELDSLLPQADIVALFLPGGSSTKHILDEKRLRLIKSNAILVNGGRGNCIDPIALKTVLKDGLLGGVGLDVTVPEPLPADDELWDYDRVLITPHASGYAHMDGVMERVLSMLLENLKRYLEGEELLYKIDRSKGY